MAISSVRPPDADTTVATARTTQFAENRAKESSSRESTNGSSAAKDRYEKQAETQRTSQSLYSGKIATDPVRYKTPEEDPFYKVMDIGAEFHDDGDAFRLTAKIPAHEQKNISANIRGDRLVITGSRRSEGSLRVSPGHALGSGAYQTFYESFPLNFPVDSHRLTREFDGDQVTIRVPKKTISS